MNSITLISQTIGYSIGVVISVLFTILALRVGRFQGPLWATLVLALCALSLNAGGLAGAIASLTGACADDEPPLLALIAKLTAGAVWSVPILAIMRQSAAYGWQRMGCRVLQVVAVLTAAGIGGALIGHAMQGDALVSVESVQQFFMHYFAVYGSTIVVLGSTFLVHRRSATRTVSLSYALILLGVLGMTLALILGVIADVVNSSLKPFVMVVGKQSPILVILGSLFLFARFRYADVFIRFSVRLLAAGALAVALAVLLRHPAFARWTELAVDPAAARTAAVILLTTSLLLAFRVIDLGLTVFVNRWIFREPDHSAAIRQLGEKFLTLHQETAIAAAAESAARTHLELEGASILPLARVPGLRGSAELNTADVIDLDCRDSRRDALPLPHVESLLPIRTEGHVSHVFAIAPGRARRALVRHEVAFLRAVAMQFAARLDSLRVERAMVEQRSREALLQQQITEAELRALRAQINPHFLFNALNTIADLIVTDPARAETMTLRLSQVFRHVLTHASRPLTSVQEEIDFLRTYLYIEETRFGDRLQVQIDLDPEAAGALIPSLILQPLVENALKHGLAPKPGAVRLWINATAGRDRIRLQIEDDGVGMDAGDLHHANARVRRTRRSPADGAGLGLKNVTERLRTLYRDGASLSLAPRAAGGSCATIVIPVVATPVALS